MRRTPGADTSEFPSETSEETVAQPVRYGGRSGAKVPNFSERTRPKKGTKTEPRPIGEHAKEDRKTHV